LSIRIRRLRTTDQVALDAAELPFTVEQLLLGADRNLSVALILEDADRIVGLAHASAFNTPEGSDPTTALLDRLAVEPGYEDHGAKLTARLSAYAHTVGFDQIFARVLPGVAHVWQDAGWQIAQPGFVFGWTEADQSRDLIRTFAADDIRDDGKLLAIRVADDTTGLYTFTFQYGHATPGARADYALRAFRELMDHPLSGVAGTVDHTQYRVI
jgi:hypothetical protein